MNSKHLDHLTKTFVVGTRRHAVAGLAALALGGAAVFREALSASANARQHCLSRCVGHRGGGGKLQKKRHKCRALCRARY
jgi:hypothetical protein